MIGKLIRRAFIVFFVMLLLSKINLQTSIYEADKNSLEIIFPLWKTDAPWLYFYWTPGTVSWNPPS